MTTETQPVRRPVRRVRPLTPRQVAILGAIVRRIRELGSAPTMREIGDDEAVRISSTSVVNYHLLKLEQHGLIGRSEYTPRGLHVTARAREVLPELFPPTPAESVLSAVIGARDAGEPLPDGVVAALEAVS